MMFIQKIIYAMAHASALTDDEEEKLFLNAMEAAGQSTFAGRKYVEILLRKNRIKEAEEILKKDDYTKFFRCAFHGIILEH